MRGEPCASTAASTCASLSGSGGVWRRQTRARPLTVERSPPLYDRTTSPPSSWYSSAAPLGAANRTRVPAPARKSILLHRIRSRAQSRVRVYVDLDRDGVLHAPAGRRASGGHRSRRGDGPFGRGRLEPRERDLEAARHVEECVGGTVCGIGHPVECVLE